MHSKQSTCVKLQLGDLKKMNRDKQHIEHNDRILLAVTQSDGTPEELVWKCLEDNIERKNPFPSRFVRLQSEDSVQIKGEHHHTPFRLALMPRGEDSMLKRKCVFSLEFI